MQLIGNESLAPTRGALFPPPGAAGLGGSGCTGSSGQPGSCDLDSGMVENMLGSWETIENRAGGAWVEP
jgi:hypothetical protein